MPRARFSASTASTAHRGWVHAANPFSNARYALGINLAILIENPREHSLHPARVKARNGLGQILSIGRRFSQSKQHIQPIIGTDLFAKLEEGRAAIATGGASVTRSARRSARGLWQRQQYPRTRPETHT